MRFRKYLSIAGLLLATGPVCAGGIAHNFNGRWGGMEIYDAHSTLSFRVNLPRLSERMAPCSTFYIPAAVVGLKAGLIKPAGTEITRGETQFPATHYWPSAWREQRHDLRSAAENSVPWYLQDITNKRGAPNIRRDLETLKYGNADISGGLDGFWRSSSLQISGLEQVDFIRKVREGQVGLNQQQTAALLESLRLSSEGDHVLYGKTGSCERAEGDLYGLFVGFVEEAGKPRAYFSLTVDGTSVADVATVRRQIVIDSMVELGFWPAPVVPTAFVAELAVPADAATPVSTDTAAPGVAAAAGLPQPVAVQGDGFTGSQPPADSTISLKESVEPALKVDGEG